jgi:hypothetical protein
MVRGFDKRFYFVMLVALVVVGLVYGSNPAVMGHSGEELKLTGDVVMTDNFCRKVTGNDCGGLSGVVLEKAILDEEEGSFSVMGHSGDDLMLNVDTSVDDAFCKKVTGNDCGGIEFCNSSLPSLNSEDGSLSVGHAGGEISLTGDSVISNEFCRKVTGVDCGEVRCAIGCGDYAHGEVVETGVDQVVEAMTSYSYRQDRTWLAKPYGRTYFKRLYKKMCKNGVIEKNYENWKVDHCMLTGKGSYHEAKECEGTDIAPGVYGEFGLCASHGYGFVWGTCESIDTSPKNPDAAVEIPD